ncbi:tetratricopeptide repeat-containing sensor histidine kinase [Flagellimonas zhangzhouensis]|uniref:histidine kinase n=1 Tax=Flagellimonas zhangzhouensis TaxID=1073328 RepID=A0A1H2S4Q1_9FLAO|nr:sensor histidine kinase [Allomuricauda zhangzhouensis]SDQ70099.1 Histidine kinase [Allomuricauda zhangzhouensis]SDW25949.1 Histidine kinase [Allomuricauda zhangzhouensis]
MKKGIYILILCCFWACSKPEKTEAVVADSKVDSIQALIKIAKKAKELSLEDRKAYLIEAESTANTLTNDTLKLKGLSEVSLIYFQFKDSSNFRRSNARIADLAERAKIPEYSGYSNWDLATFLERYGVMDSAYFNYQKALTHFEQMPIDSTSSSLRARMLYGMGRMQDSYQDYLGAEINVTEAIKIFDDLEDNLRLYNSYSLMGVLAKGLGNSQKSLEAYQIAQDYLNKYDGDNKSKIIWQNRHNIASVYFNEKDYAQAKILFEEIIKNKDSSNKATYEKALGSLAYSILKLDNNVDGAEALLQEAYSVNKERDDHQDLARIHQFYAEVLAAKGDTAKAIEVAKESKAIALETFNNERSLEALKLLTNLDTAHAAAYANEYYALDALINEEERTKRNKFARISFETDQVIEANQALTEETEAWASAVSGLVVFGLTFTVIVALYINNNRLRNRQIQQASNQEIYNLLLSQQGKFEEGRQLEQKRISEELHDGILGEMLGIRLILGGLNGRTDEASIDQRAELIEKLRGVEEEVRTISHELNNSSYEKFHNFIVSLEDMIDDVEKSSGMKCSFSYDKKVPWDRLLGDIKINAYRVIQEALKNCVKHAKSKHVSITFLAIGDDLKLTIADDGVGFDVNRGRKGIGIRNIISRTKKLKGKLDIDSEKGKGTSISILIPTQFVNSNVSESKEPINA